MSLLFIFFSVFVCVLYVLFSEYTLVTPNHIFPVPPNLERVFLRLTCGLWNVPELYKEAEGGVSWREESELDL